MKRLLLVDDDDAVRRSVARLLRNEFDDIAQASDGHEAITMAFADPPALIITDGEMRRMHGPELIAELRKVPSLASVPVILCSGNHNLKEIAKRLGVPFFQKAHDNPLSLRELVRNTVAGR